MPTTMKRSKLDQEALAQALDRHTEALFKRRAGSDESRYRHEPDAAALFNINRQLYDSLAPVEPSDAFVEGLKTRLMGMHHIETQRKGGKAVQQRRQQVRKALSVWAVVTIGAQVLGSIILVAAFIVTRRRRAAAAA